MGFLSEIITDASRCVPGGVGRGENSSLPLNGQGESHFLPEEARGISFNPLDKDELQAATLSRDKEIDDPVFSSIPMDNDESRTKILSRDKKIADPVVCSIPMDNDESRTKNFPRDKKREDPAVLTMPMEKDEVQAETISLDKGIDDPADSAMPMDKGESQTEILYQKKEITQPFISPVPQEKKEEPVKTGIPVKKVWNDEMLAMRKTEEMIMWNSNITPWHRIPSSGRVSIKTGGPAASIPEKRKTDELAADDRTIRDKKHHSSPGQKAAAITGLMKTFTREVYFPPRAPRIKKEPVNTMGKTGNDNLVKMHPADDREEGVHKTNKYGDSQKSRIIEPAVHIGYVEVIIETPQVPGPVKGPVKTLPPRTSVDNLTSRMYLRRL